MADTTGDDAADTQRLRASDADRERVAEALHRAAGEGRLSLDELQERLDTVYASRTYGELAPVLSDLPDTAAGTLVPAGTGTPATSPRVTADQDASSVPIVGIMSGPSRRGDWLVPPTQVAVAFLGGVTLDLREARFAAAEITIHAYAVLGGVEILVPEDLSVRVEGFGFMGGFDDHASGAGDPDGPVVRIVGFAFWGGVDVKRKPPRKRKKRSAAG